MGRKTAGFVSFVILIALAYLAFGQTVAQTPAPPTGVTIGAPPARFTLTVTKTGAGTGNVTGMGITCGTDCTQSLNPSTSVVLTAEAITGSVFGGWSGCDTTDQLTCNVIMSAAKDVSVAFDVADFTVSVTKSGTGLGIVTSSPAGINCGAFCTANFAFNTSVALSATPTFPSTFVAWTGDCAASGACNLTMTDAKNVNAEFNLAPTQFVLTVTKAGTGAGTVTSSPAGIACGATCAFSFDASTVVTLTAVAGAGSTFTGWSNEGCSGTGTCVVTMSQARAVTATFTVDAGPGCTVSIPADYATVNQFVQAAAEGDKICVTGTGTVTWASTLTVSGNKSISLIGPGRDLLTIQNSATTTAGKILNISMKATGGGVPSKPGFFRISGFAFKAVTACSGGTPSILTFGGQSANFRFDNNRVTTTGVSSCRGIYISNLRGVIDHNNFVTNQCCVHLLVVDHISYLNVGTNGHNSYAQPASTGTAEQMHMENNVWDYTNNANIGYITDAFEGTRWTFRFETIRQLGTWGANLQNHGTESSGLPRGMRHTEYYENTFPLGGDHTSRLLVVRGGTGYAIRNRLTGGTSGLTHFNALNTYRSTGQIRSSGYYPYGMCRLVTPTSLTCSGTTATLTYPPGISYDNMCSTNHVVDTSIVVSGADQSQYNVFGALANCLPGGSLTYTISSCPGTATGSNILVGNVYDGRLGLAGSSGANEESKAYPCIDQAGRGQSILYSGEDYEFNPKLSPTNQTAFNKREPFYAVDNTLNGVPSYSANEAPNVIRANRDYYDESGGLVGKGERTLRPVSCTPGPAGLGNDPQRPGQAWLAIGPGNGPGTWNTTGTSPSWELDVCISVGDIGTWVNGYYTPYTYPHPLTTLP